MQFLVRAPKRLVSRLTVALVALCALGAFGMAAQGASALTVAAGAVLTDPGCFTNDMGPNDDGSSPQVPIGFPINFFGNTYSNAWVNNNGNLTFDGPQGAYTPYNLYTQGVPIVAPFFADVDTRGPSSGTTHWGNTTANGRPALCASWATLNPDNTLTGVGYFGGHTDKLNTFQALLIDRSDTGAGNFDIEFNYNQIQWESGDFSGGSGGLGGSSARVGYSNGQSQNSFEEPGSGVPGSFEDTNPTGLKYRTRNSTVPGRIIYQVRSGQVSAGSVGARGTVTATDASGAPTSAQFSAINDCNAASSPRPFIIQWGSSRFTKRTVTNSSCTNDSTLPQTPTGFNTQTGDATGTLRDGTPAVVHWTFRDAAPGYTSPPDTVQFMVTSPDGSTTYLSASQQSPSAFNGSPGGVVAQTAH